MGRVGQFSIRSMRNLVWWVLTNVAINAVILFLLALWLNDFDIRTYEALIGLSLLLVVLPALAWPVIYRLSNLIHPLLFPVFSFALTGLLVMVSPDILREIGIDGVQIHGFQTGLWIALGLTFFETLIAAMFSLDDEEAYDRYVTSQLVNAYRRHQEHTTVPGIMFIEIDGLAEPVLRRAIAEGYMPHVKSWIDEGRYEITRWEPDLSSQTSASQAGILLGNNTNIPAFRWWDKERGKLMVSSSMETARALEAELSSGNGLLVNDGASRFNVFSGDAIDAVCTFSRVSESPLGKQGSYFLYFSNPYVLARTVGLFVADFVREIWQSINQRRRKETPRLHRKIRYAPIRASTTTLMQEAARFMATADIVRGVSSAYYTMFGYDEVAHHSNIESTDGLKVLKTLDRMLSGLERAAMHAPRPMHIVVLSDHGQSQGATFLQRYNESLSDVVQRLVEADSSVHSILDTDEGLANLSVTINQALKQDRRTVELARRVLGSRASSDGVDLGPQTEEMATTQQAVKAGTEVIVLASGNLGLVSFPQIPHRLTLEELGETHPGLIVGLVGHPGIGFVMVRSSVDGTVVIGKNGLVYLDADEVVGESPMAIYGPNAAQHLKRADGFSNVPDIYVMSLYEPETGEVAAFEELVGCHGGLGGPQTEPFIMHPVWLSAGNEPIVGAAHLCQVMKHWLAEVGQQNGNIAPRPVDQGALVTQGSPRSQSAH
jgi:putative membrane protein